MRKRLKNFVARHENGTGDRAGTRRGLRAGVAALAVLAVLVLLGVNASSASAATIPGAVKTITTTTTTVAQGQTFELDGTWAVPDGSQPGDTFTMQLPAQLKWYGSTDFNLTDPAGDVVATAHADANGLVTFTLGTYVATHSTDVHGTFTFITEYTATQTAPGPETLIFNTGGSVVRVPIVDQGPGTCTSNCSGTPTTYPKPFKSMWWSDSTQTATQSQLGAYVGDAASNDVTVTDTPGAGLALDCSSLTYHVGTHTDQNGNVVAPEDTDTYKPTIVCSPNSATVTWTGLPAHETVEVLVVSKVTDASLSVYKNAGTIVINGTNTPVSDITKRKDASGTGDGTAPSTPPIITQPSSSTAPTTTVTVPTGVDAGHPGAASHGDLELELLGGLMVLGGLGALGAQRVRSRQH